MQPNPGRSSGNNSPFATSQRARAGTGFASIWSCRCLLVRAVVKQQLSGGSVLEVKMTDLGSFAPTNGVVLVSLIVTPYF